MLAAGGAAMRDRRRPRNGSSRDRQYPDRESADTAVSTILLTAYMIGMVEEIQDEYRDSPIMHLACNEMRPGSVFTDYTLRISSIIESVDPLMYIHSDGFGSIYIPIFSLPNVVCPMYK